MFSQKEAVGFCCDRWPDGRGYTYTLTSKLGELLFEAETRFGQRDRDWTLLGIEFSGEIPHVWYPGNRQYVSIILSDNARGDPRRALFQLSHEVIHVLAPTGGRHGLMIEEGLATLFSMEISARHQLNFFYNDLRYFTALAPVQKLLTRYPEGIKLIREKQPSFLKFTPELIRSILPDVPDDVANELCKPFPY